MPDIIRPTLVNSTVVVTISAVADQSTLNAVAPTVSATVDGLAATITAWAWKVNGATTGITGPTTVTPSYTPTTAGAKVITVDVTIGGVVYSSLPEIFTVGPTTLSISIAAVADQLGLTAATLDSTVTGGVTPYTYAWTVDGATTGLSSSTAADPTYTPTTAGVRTAVVTVTDAAGQTAKVSVTWTVGDADRRVQKTHANWMLAENAVDFTVEATKTVDGLTYSEYSPGTVTLFAATEGVGLSITPGSNVVGLRIPGDAMGVSLETDVVYYMALAAGTLNVNNDGVKIVVSSGAVYAATWAIKSAGGVQQIGTENASGSRFETTAGAGQVRQLAFRIRGYLCEVYYSETAFSGSFPAVSAMTKASSAPAGFFVFDNVPGNDTTDSRAPASDFVYWLGNTGAVVIERTEIRVAA